MGIYRYIINNSAGYPTLQCYVACGCYLLSWYGDLHHKQASRLTPLSSVTLLMGATYYHGMGIYIINKRAGYPHSLVLRCLWVLPIVMVWGSTTLTHQWGRGLGDQSHQWLRGGRSVISRGGGGGVSSVVGQVGEQCHQWWGRWGSSLISSGEVGDQSSVGEGVEVGRSVSSSGAGEEQCHQQLGRWGSSVSSSETGGRAVSSVVGQ